MKKLIIASIMIFMAANGSAQSFFKPLPKVATPGKFARAQGITEDSTIYAFRPIANIAAYAEPGNILMAGAGISYQKLKWDIVNQKWNSPWSISGLMWAGGSVAPNNPTQAISYGIMFGVLNNLIMVGPAINGKKVIATVAIGISLNN